MKINKLVISNFKGILNLVATFNGSNATIYGNNGTGKTTVYDAFLWLLFGKDSQSSSKFSIKPINAPAETEVTVTGVFEIDGKTVELKKVLKENWTKKRGSTEKTYTGDITYCFVDEVPYKVTEYSEHIANICFEDVFKLLTNPMHFNTNIKWQDRRKTLFAISGEVTDIQMFEDLLKDYTQAEEELKQALTAMQEDATNDEALETLKQKQVVLSNLKGYKALHQAMGEHTLDDFKKILVDRKKSNIKDLEAIPAKIDEKAQSIVEVDVKLAEKNLIELKEKQQENETELNKIQTGADIAKLNAQLSDNKTKLQSLERNNIDNHNRQEDSHRQKINSDAKDLETNLDKVSSELRQTTGLFHNVLSQIDTQKQLIDRYHKEYTKVIEEQQSLNTVCPTCNQVIPQEQIEKAQQNFIEYRNKKLDELKKLGTNARIKAQEFEKQKQELSSKGQALATQKKLIEEQIERIKSNPCVLKDLPKYATDKANLQVQIQATESEIVNAKAISSQEAERLKIALQTVRSEVEKLQEDVRQHKLNVSLQEQIETLEFQQKLCIKQDEEIEKHLFYCDLFTKKKVNLISKQVNSKFKIANFKMFNTLVNGSIEDCCEVEVNGVPFSDLNNAMKINVGIDVISTLQQYYNFAPPIFIDNAESVTDVYKLNSQMIKLVVPPAYESLPQAVQVNITRSDYYAVYNKLKIEKEVNTDEQKH